MASTPPPAVSKPPCVLSKGLKPQHAQTYVMKLSPGSDVRAFLTWLNGRLADGAGAWAQVSTQSPALEHPELYIVLTENVAHRVECRARTIREQVAQLPRSPQADWIRPLTRRLQRLLRWGDVTATRGDVVRATKAGDLQELKAIMPEAGEAFLESEDLSQLPAVFDAIRAPAPALEDCKHDWYSFEGPLAARDKCADLKEKAEKTGQPFDEPIVRGWLMKGDVGRCRRDVQHLGPFWRCTLCRLVLCHKCTNGKYKERVVTLAIEELKEKMKDDPLVDLPDGVQCQWRQHPERPQPFFVIDQEKVSDEEKVLWIRQELGSNATLPELCAKFIELFGDKLRGPVPQKALCLKLYAMYAPDSREAAWKKEGDLPPRDMVEFQRVWDAEAPNRCLECRKPLEGTAASFRDSSYCSDKCKCAGVVATCTRCTPEQKCRYCQLAPSGKRKYTSKLDQGEKQLDRMRQVLGHERRSVDPDHEPAWKRRRRS